MTQGEGKDPTSFLGDIIGNMVTVKLNSGVIYKGEFGSLSAGPGSPTGTGLCYAKGSRYASANDSTDKAGAFPQANCNRWTAT